MLVVETGRMPGVTDDKTGPVVVHASLAPSHEKMTRLAHGSGAVQEGRTDGRRAVPRGSAQGELVAVTPNPIRGTEGKVERKQPRLSGQGT